MSSTLVRSHRLFCAVVLLSLLGCTSALPAVLLSFMGCVSGLHSGNVDGVTQAERGGSDHTSVREPIPYQADLTGPVTGTNRLSEPRNLRIETQPASPLIPSHGTDGPGAAKSDGTQTSHQAQYGEVAAVDAAPPSAKDSPEPQIRRQLTRAVKYVNPGRGTLQAAFDNATNGDEFVLRDGNYTAAELGPDALYGWRFAMYGYATSGYVLFVHDYCPSSGSPCSIAAAGTPIDITFRAENDGQAVLDGENLRPVIKVSPCMGSSSFYDDDSINGRLTLKGLVITRGAALDYYVDPRISPMDRAGGIITASSPHLHLVVDACQVLNNTGGIDAAALSRGDVGPSGARAAASHWGGEPSYIDATGTFTMMASFVHKNSEFGVRFGQYANITSTQIFDNAGTGVHVGASADFDSCEIHGNTNRGVDISLRPYVTSTLPVAFRSCIIRANSCDEQKQQNQQELDGTFCLGGGVFAATGLAIFDSCTIIANQAVEGGGIAIWQGQVAMKSVLIDGNTASKDGGGVYIHIAIRGTHPELNSTSCDITNNVALLNGGGIALKIPGGRSRQAAISFNSGTISGNRANQGGGVSQSLRDPANSDVVSTSLYVLRFQDCQIAHNVANASAGGVEWWYGTTYYTRCDIFNNSAFDDGAIKFPSTRYDSIPRLAVHLLSTRIFDNIDRSGGSLIIDGSVSVSAHDFHHTSSADASGSRINGISWLGPQTLFSFLCNISKVTHVHIESPFSMWMRQCDATSAPFDEACWMLEGSVPDALSCLARDLTHLTLVGSRHRGKDLFKDITRRIVVRSAVSAAAYREALPDYIETGLADQLPMLNHFSSLTHLVLRRNFFKGTLPALDNTSLTYLDVSDNDFTGPLPDLSSLAGLTNVIINDNFFTGQPPNPFDFPNLLCVDRLSAVGCFQIERNNFTLPVLQELFVWSTENQGIDGAPLMIEGAPGHGSMSCSAYGSSMISIMSPGECVGCPEDLVLLAVVLITAAVGALVLFIVYLVLITTFPNFGGWIATTSILLGQLQILAALSMLKSIQGSTTQFVFKLSGVIFLDVSAASPECLLNAIDMDPFAAGNYVMMAMVSVPALVIFYQLTYKCCTCVVRMCCKPKLCAPASVDSLEDKAITFYTTMFNTVTKIWMYLTVVEGGLGTAFAILGLQALYTLYLLCMVRSLRSHSNGKVKCCNITTKQRLERRLRYVLARFGQHAPYWQFVVWVRQAALFVAPRFLARLEAIPQSAIPMAELLLLILLQYKFQPFPERRQNQLELGGLCVSFLLVGLGMVYSTMLAVAGPSAQQAVDILMLAVFIVLWLVMGIRFKRQEKQEKLKMAKTTTASEASNVEPSAVKTSDTELVMDTDAVTA